MAVSDLRAQLQKEIAATLTKLIKEGRPIPLTEQGMAIIENAVKSTIREFMQRHHIAELFDTGITVEQLRKDNDWPMLARVPAGTPECFTLWCSEWSVKAEAPDARARRLSLCIDPAGTIEFRAPWF